LKELMNLEEDRIRQEDEEKKKRAEAEVQARQEAERRAREQEQQRLHAEEERRRGEEQRKKEEAARLEAIRHAEIEKARVEAEQKAKLEAMTAQQAHQLQLSSLQHDEHKKKLQRMVTFGGIGGAILVVGGIFLFVSKSKENDAREAAARAALVQQADEAKKLQAQLTEQSQKVNELMSALASAQDEKTRAELRAKLDEARRNQAEIIKKRNPAPGGGDSPKPAKKDCNCQPGDPLCSCL
jgi:colicin import membrane protein